MILNIRNLEFSYNSKPLIQDVSFSIKEGEILAILGPNGAGKTTLLKCLNRILTPKKGLVEIDGIDISKMKKIDTAREIGWVPQNGEVSRMKVYNLILLGRKPYFRWEPRSEDYAMVEEAIRILGIEELSMRYADEISGGEFQMVQVARALAQDSQVILFDEPTSSLDISNQHRLMTKIQELIHNSETSAIMTMHDINLALRYCDKFLLLKDGSICAAGNSSIINPENIEAVYGMIARVVDAGGQLFVVPE